MKHSNKFTFASEETDLLKVWTNVKSS